MKKEVVKQINDIEHDFKKINNFFKIINKFSIGETDDELTTMVTATNRAIKICERLKMKSDKMQELNACKINAKKHEKNYGEQLFDNMRGMF